MPTEIESKLRVASHEPVRARLASLGATFVRRIVETNRLFARTDGSLRRADCGLRIRTAHVVEGATLPATLTFKGPRQAGPFKRRREIETEIADAETMTAVLDVLGFEERHRFEKKRESWRLGACGVDLDELPSLGAFVEVEGPDEAAISEALRGLQLANAQPVQETYVEMVAKLAAPDAARPFVLAFDRPSAP